MSKDTVFTNDTGAAGGTSSYVQDVLADVTFPASNNTGLTDNANTNPLGKTFADDDLPKFGAKTLYIKDLLLLADRSKWISNKPTYQVIFNETYPAVSCHIFGNINFLYNQNQPVIQLKNIGDGISVNGVIRRVAFMVNGDTAATATAQVVVDGSNGNTIDFSSLASATDTQGVNRFAAFAHSSSNETNDLHDIRLTALQANTLKLVGVIVYFENTGANIAQSPGTTYVNKTKATTTTGATLSLPTFGSSLGGVASIYKTTTLGYTAAAFSAGTVSSTATGSSGTNLLTLTTGHGSSFGGGYGVIVSSGSSVYVGNVLSVSTDTLTMGNTLGFGTSTTASIYTAWKAGQTYAINASLMTLAKTIDFSSYNLYGGVSSAILDVNGAYAFWGGNIGLTLIDSVQAAYFLGASGFMQTDGYFSAAEVEFVGNGILHATFGINGFPCWSVNAGQTGIIKKTVFTDAGPGWNSFVMNAGASIGALGVAKINLYQRNRNTGISYGVLAQFDQCQTFTDRGAINSTLMALGGLRRVYADQLYLKGGVWSRGQTFTAPGGAFYVGSSTSAVMSVQYYGKNFGIVGTAGGGTLTLDGAGISLGFNGMHTVASEGFHTVQYTVGSAATATIQAFDFVRSTNRFNYVANVLPTPITSVSKGAVKSMVHLQTGNGSGAVSTAIRRFTTIVRNIGTAINYTDDSNTGAAFQILEDGVYSIFYGDRYESGAFGMGLSVNTTQPTTSILSITGPTKLGEMQQAGAQFGVITVTAYLKAGDVVRAHHDGNCDNNSAGRVNFIITQVSRG
jgi:hypothetical protein